MSCDGTPASPPVAPPPPEPTDGVQRPPEGLIAWAQSLRPRGERISAPPPEGGEVRLGVSGWCPHCRSACFRNPVLGSCRACGQSAWPVRRRRLIDDPPEDGTSGASWRESEDPRRMLCWLCGHGEGGGMGPVLGARLAVMPGDRTLRLFALSVALLAAPLMSGQAAGAVRELAPLLWHFGGFPASRLRAIQDYLRKCRDMAHNGYGPLAVPAIRLAMAVFQEGIAGAACHDSYWQSVAAACLERGTVAALLRDAVGEPFDPPGVLHGGRRWRPGRDGLEATPFPWATPQAVALAQAALDGRDEWGTLDRVRLGVLADCLEEGGLADGTGPGGVLAHLRGPWPHGIGCWALGLILGK